MRRLPLLLFSRTKRDSVRKAQLFRHTLSECQVRVIAACRGERRWKGSSDNLTGLRQRRTGRSNSDLVSFGVRETKRGQSEPPALCTEPCLS